MFGLDGKRFKTRSGDTVRLVDLLDEAVTRMEAQLRERISSGSANISEGEVHKTACILGYGAVKYFDLRRNPTSNYIFSYDRMLDTKVRRCSCSGLLPFLILFVNGVIVVGVLHRFYSFSV
jgi:arginyl-tRNA synthetase